MASSSISLPQALTLQPHLWSGGVWAVPPLPSVPWWGGRGLWFRTSAVSAAQTQTRGPRFWRARADSLWGLKELLNTGFSHLAALGLAPARGHQCPHSPAPRSHLPGTVALASGQHQQHRGDGAAPERPGRWSWGCSPSWAPKWPHSPTGGSPPPR